MGESDRKGERFSGCGRRGGAFPAAHWRAAVLVLALGASAAEASDPLSRRPRPLSEAERVAVELAAAYQAEGATAWWNRFSVDSTWRQLGRESALRELAVRLGPAEGSTWVLRTPGPTFGEGTAIFEVEFPSGIEETVLLRFAREKGGWGLESVEITADPMPASQLPTTPGDSPLASLALAAGTLTLLISRTGARRGRRAVAASLALVALATAGLSCKGQTTATQSPSRPEVLRLARLAPLRSALCLGRSLAQASQELVQSPLESTLDEVRRLWEAQDLAARGDLPAAERHLRSFSRPSRFPLAELLRAQLALARLDRRGTGAAYEAAAARRLDHDGLRFAAAEAKMVTDDAPGAAIDLSLLVEMGSRAAEAWYGAGRFALVEGREAEAEELLRIAWTLRPIPRRELFGDPVLAALCARPALFPLFVLGSAREPAVEPPVEATGPREPLLFPPGTTVTTSGAALRAEVHGARLEVPGGAALAPIGGRVVDAVSWADDAEEKALARLASLRVQAAAEPDPLQPRLLRQAELAAEALARQNRWREIEELTAPFAAARGDLPAQLVRLRALALGRLDRNAEARDLLVKLAVGDLGKRVAAPGTLYDLAELLVKAEEYDKAMKLIRRADAQLASPHGESRLRQIELDQVLSASFLRFRSPHFDIRYPATSGELYARKVATVLEQERQRESRWVPLVEGPRLEVHLFEMQPFFTAYGDMGVVGVFDGRVRVPFADLMSLHPELVRILSHELCHSLIAAATHDRAPAWFHEGLAQHVEMGTSRVNPLPDLRREGRAIAFPVLGPILAGFAEPQFVELAYSESAWAVSFLESRWGTAGLRRMMDSYAAGKTDEQAIRDLTGLDLVAFDRAFWEWGATTAPAVRLLETRRFDEELDGPVERSSRGLTPSAAPPAGRGGAVSRPPSLAEPATRESVAQWHRRYAERVAAAKLALRPILAGYEPGAAPATAADCARLETELRQARQEPTVFESPVRSANRSLLDAYYQLQQVAAQCGIGRHDLALDSLARARNRLAAAAAELAPFGVSP